MRPYSSDPRVEGRRRRGAGAVAQLLRGGWVAREFFSPRSDASAPRIRHLSLRFGSPSSLRLNLSAMS